MGLWWTQSGRCGDVVTALRFPWWERLGGGARDVSVVTWLPRRSWARPGSVWASALGHPLVLSAVSSRRGVLGVPSGPTVRSPSDLRCRVRSSRVASVFGGGTASSVVFVVCVPSLSVVQPLDCWSDPMALVALTLWGSGASRRRQSLPDDLHSSQSCPGDSEQHRRMGSERGRGHSTSIGRAAMSAIAPDAARRGRC